MFIDGLVNEVFAYEQQAWILQATQSQKVNRTSVTEWFVGEVIVIISKKNGNNEWLDLYRSGDC